jgi:hypothetical protein
VSGGAVVILVHPACHWQRIRALLTANRVICSRRTRAGAHYLVIKVKA